MATTTLTDRYVEAALRHTPSDGRAELELELRGLIDDTVDARMERDGVDRGDAEYAALGELGDPELFAQRYSGRPMYLIGPKFYLSWKRLLRLLLLIVVPIVVLLRIFAEVNDGGTALATVGAAVSAAVVVAVQVTFWTTLSFVMVERFSPDTDDLDAEWTPDALPDAGGALVSISDTAWTVAMSVIVIVALFVQRSARLVTVDDEPVPILDPDLWSFWLPLLIACLLAEIAIAIVVFVRGRWSWPIYAVFAVPQLVFAGAVLWLCASDEMLNPALIAGVDWGEMQDPARILNAALAVGVIGVTGWDLIEKARATMRS